MDMHERGRVSKHFYVECSDEHLFDFSIGELWLCDFLFDVGELIGDDSVLLLFRFGLSYTFDECFKIFGEMIGSHVIKS